MAGVILDTSVLVAAEREDLDLERFLAAHGAQRPAISAITASEMLRGVERSGPRHRARREAFVEDVFATFAVLAFTMDAARVHARAWAALAAQGIVVGPHDLLIAATALEVGAVVATLNRREFERVPGLVLADLAPYMVAR